MTSPARLVERLQGVPVAVAGDVMLDHFLVGRVDRISPEAPVPVVRFGRDEYRLGGAANVAYNLTSLGGAARLVGVTGEDEAAAHVRAALAGAGIDTQAVIADAARPTTRKVRIVTSRNQQVARVDYEEEREIGGEILARVVRCLAAVSHGARAIVLSDYRKGVVTPEVIRAAVEAAGSAGAPLLIDPKVPQPDRYRGATLITPNHQEAELMTQTVIRTIDDARQAARLLHERTGASVLITWGEHGMWVFDASASGTEERALPAAAREVADVTGAGDTVIAVLALGLGAGARLVEAAELATAAAGLVVARFGPAALTREQLLAATGGAAP
jgi:D-beta-D-heptose 7-phosphate kinase/D-beta-D-heptose 1-phosphate adenosyltransferase